MADLGRAALIVSLGLSFYALVAGTCAAMLQKRRLAQSARNALFACFASTVVAALVLISALLRHDFSFTYVWQHTSSDLPTPYTLSAFWGGQEGSLLLWLLVLSGYAAISISLNRKLLSDVIPWVVPVFGGVMTFFAFMLVFISSPFNTQVRALVGEGLNPSLQNPYMVAHPPMLYLGYVGLTVPFAFAAGAMLSGRTDERWIIATRRWTLAAWTFLGVGQLLGAHWAYEVIGWGGYYAWDPVENAALMPWLVATAFLHSVMIQERKGMLKVWNMVLVCLAFGLSIFGTFLTRSGLIASVHSFTKSSLGGWFLGFLIITTVFSVSLILWRLPLLQAKTKFESALSREATFLYNNLLLVALALTILWGVLWPIVTDFFYGQQRIMGRPYYDFFLRAFGLPLLLLMGIGPLVAWRRTSARALIRTLRWPLLTALIVGGVLIAFGAGSSQPGLIAYTFCSFVLAAIVLELVRGTRVTGSLVELIARNRRRYGGYVVHAAIVLFVIGVAGSSAYQTVREHAFKQPGDSVTVSGNKLTYEGIKEKQSATGTSVLAVFKLSGESKGTMDSGVKFFSADDSNMTAAGIKTNYLLGQDLYTIVSFSALPGKTIGNGPTAVDTNGGVYVKILVKPLVNLIWLAGFLFLAGALVAMWPDAREQRRLVARMAPARA